MKAQTAVQTTASSSSTTDSNLVLQRKCACGGPTGLSGTCEECAEKKLLGQPLQTKLMVGSADDPLEREADRVAEQVMRMPEPGLQRHANNERDAALLPAKLLVQRKSFATQDCEAGALSSVHELLRSPGQPLGTAERQYFEPRFGRDFSHVRVHTNALAGESARAVDARAYTVGGNIAFAEGQYSPHTAEGKRLLAHELTHVVQQGGAESNRKHVGNGKQDLPPFSRPPFSMIQQSGVRRIRPGQRHDAASLFPRRDSAHLASSVFARPSKPGVSSDSASRLQRKMSVSNPGDKPAQRHRTNAETILYFLQTLCPSGVVDVDPVSGVIDILSSGFCSMSWSCDPRSPAEKSRTPTGCDCVCDLVNSDNLWKIEVSDAASNPETIPIDALAGVGEQQQGGCWYTSGHGTGGRIITPSELNPKRFGVATESGRLESTPAWLIFGHELCGHAWDLNAGKASRQEAETRGRGGHQDAVTIENRLRAEFNLSNPIDPLEMRANFCGPYCGESFWRDKARPGVPQSFENEAPGADKGKTFMELCKASRDAYNRRHATQFTVKDRLPENCI